MNWATIYLGAISMVETILAQHRTGDNEDAGIWLKTYGFLGMSNVKKSNLNY